MYYSRSENDNNEKEPLEVHLNRTAKLAGEFAENFNEKDAGYLCGLLHDAGKASELFQGVLNHTEHKINHEAAGSFF